MDKNLNLALFAIENVSDNDLDYLSEAIGQEKNFRKYECKKKHLIHNENLITNSRQECINAQTAELSQMINTHVQNADGEQTDYLKQWAKVTGTQYLKQESRKKYLDR